MTKFFRVLAIFCISLLTACQSSESAKEFTVEDINIIPKPASVSMQKGSFTFDQNTQFVVEGEQQEEFSGLLLDRFKTVADWSLQTAKEVPQSNYVVFETDSELPEESYILDVSEDRIQISAASLSGFVYGMESLRQLLPVEIESPEKVSDISWTVPAVLIEDSPRYEWRGLHQDVARHFLEKEYILKVIDRMAMLKLNTLHFHLVDDQGWRLEIKQYPKLTEVGAWRVDNEDKHWNARPESKKGEPTTYGGFYTQEDIKEIVAHAQSKGITVVPEVEMPAHVMSAIAAYPELSCFGKEIMVPTGGVWPITEIYCPGKETTFEFLENVMLEVMELFPSEFIHIGGDEATRTNWEICPDCQRRMAEEGLDNVEELQSYFIKRMEKFLSGHGKRIIGWDEILEGGLAPGAAVMSWRGIQGGWEASEMGHDVVMTPGSHMYLDHYQGNPDTEPVAFGGFTPLSKVYEFDPIVDSMSVEQKNHILGGQANMWSEFIPNPSHSEYMMFPRLAAVAEVLWTPEDKKDWEDFSERLRPLLKRFDYMDINYAKSAFSVTASTEIDLEKNEVRVQLENEFPNSEIRYAFNVEELTEESSVYQEPLKITKTTTIKAAVFEDGKMLGTPFNKTFQFHKAVGKEVTYKELYHDSYKGKEAVGMVNVIRGTKNFHDGQWQAWLGNDMELVIDLEAPTTVSKISVGAMEDQGSGIYFPISVEAFVSIDGENYERVGGVEREFKYEGSPELKDFIVDFEEEKAQYIKVRATNLGEPPHGGGSWLFVDEIIVE